MNVLDIKSLTLSQIEEIFSLADRLGSGGHENVLNGRTFVLFFPETSLRTRITFEKGIMDLGGRSILFPPEALDRKEPLEDVIRYMENWADGVIIRHPSDAKIAELSAYASIPVINAMTAGSHPCEILSDLYSIRQQRAAYKELVYTFVGPADNIARSWMQAAEVMKLAFNHVCAEGNRMAEDSPHYAFHTDLEAIIAESDVVLTDSLPSEFLTDSYIRSYQITAGRMKMAKEGALLNPCPPFYRNEEISEDAIASPAFVGYEFKRSLLWVQQAIILFCLDLSR